MLLSVRAALSRALHRANEQPPHLGPALARFVLAFESKGLLIGEAADPDLVQSLHDLACGKSGVVGVGDVLTVHSSPDQITVMMNVDFRDDVPAGEVERIVCDVEDEARKRWPQVRRLFVRPMQGAAQCRSH